MATDIDLTAAIDAAAYEGMWLPDDSYCPDQPGKPRRECPMCVARLMVRAAAPLIVDQAAAQERERVAAAIEANLVFLDHLDTCQTCIAGQRCARIARGGGE